MPQHLTQPCSVPVRFPLDGARHTRATQWPTHRSESSVAIRALECCGGSRKTQGAAGLIILGRLSGKTGTYYDLHSPACFITL
ncbi:hypothetical protein E2C01_064954 [Portunus trituberculatus]|uniref:Uncharacterized protein n=1 Tax=Portunus trituberculatus TaxID=210409 RepID=A0A5B7HEE7_PORTR|nr:hypothetical protein [Portunus trituberculatus]